MIAMAVAALMIAQQIAAKAARDAFFLSNFAASALPAVMIGAATLSVLVVIAVSQLLKIMSPARVVPWVFVANAALFGGEYLLSFQAPRVVAVIVYLHMAALGAAAISTFWSVINERFDPHSAKAAIARIAVGATFGGVLGGVAAWLLAGVVAIPVLFVILAVANLVCAAGIAAIGGPTAVRRESGPAASGLRVLRETPYLRHLALLVGLGAVAEAVVDFVFKASAQAEFESSSALVTFFALFYMATGLLAFVLQSALVGRALRAIGLTAAVATRAGTFVGGGLFALAFPGLWAMALLAGAANTVENTFYRSGYEILYTPLTPEKKRPTKTIIDVGFEKLGVAIGSGLVLAVVAFAPSHSLRILLGVVSLAGVLGVFICSRLHRGYVNALSESLRAGRIRLDVKDTLDRTTELAVSMTATELDREQLLAEIAKHRAANGEAEEIGSVVSEATGPDPIAAAVRDLRSGDATVVLRRLRESSLEPALVGHVVPLLSRPFSAEVIEVLGAVASRVVGQLTDALLDSAQPATVRERVAIVLGKTVEPRALSALVAGLSDPDFAVRRQCALILDRSQTSGGNVLIEEAAVFALVRREANGDAGVPAQKRLTHIANLLGLVRDRETVRLAARALVAADDGLRGTGLEYLENVVPTATYLTLRPLIRDVPRKRKARRPAQQVVGELLLSVDTQGIDVDAIRAHIETKRE